MEATTSLILYIGVSFLVIGGLFWGIYYKVIERMRIDIDKIKQSVEESLKTPKRDAGAESSSTGVIVRILNEPRDPLEFLLQIMALGLSQSAPVWNRMREHRVEKQRLGRYVAENFLRKVDTVLLDSGTTTAAVARELVRLRCRVREVYTNNVLAALYLLPYEETKCILVGGELDQNYAALLGEMSVNAIKDLKPDITILAATSIDYDTGPHGRSSTNQAFKQAIMTSAEKLVIVVDASKLGQIIGDPVLDRTEWGKIRDREGTKIVCAGEPDAAHKEAFKHQVKKFGEKLVWIDKQS